MKIAKVLFRCDASNEIGFGHMRRCLNLMQWLRGKYDVALVTKKTKEAEAILAKCEFEVVYLRKDKLPQEELPHMQEVLMQVNPKVVVNDIKETTPEYMQLFSAMKIRTINFDDLGKGAATADALIDANRRENKKKLFGPKYAVLHSQYARANKKPRILHKQPKNLLVAIGGGDPNNFTQRVLECLDGIEPKFNTAVVLGPTFVNAQELKKKWHHHEYVHFIEGLDTLVTPLLWADVAIVNGGMTMFEALATGTPVLTVAQNEPELKNIKRFERKSALLDVGLGSKVSVNKLNKRLKKICNDLDYRTKLSTHAKEEVDGKGLYRVLAVIERFARKSR